MDELPPPTGWSGGNARGIKRTHAQMSTRQRSSSRVTRSPSVIVDFPTIPQSSTSRNLPPITTDLLERHRRRQLARAEATHVATTSQRREQLRPYLNMALQNEDEQSRPRSVDLAEENGANVGNQEQHRDLNNATPLNVIDLTDDSAQPTPQSRRPYGHARRGPRFPVEIIDLSADTPQRSGNANQRRQANDAGVVMGEGEEVAGDLPQIISSPEVQFVRARIRTTPQAAVNNNNLEQTSPPARPPNRLDPHGALTPIVMLDDDDDVEIVEERLGIAPPPAPHPGSQGLYQLPGVLGRLAGMRHNLGNELEHLGHVLGMRLVDGGMPRRDHRSVQPRVIGTARRSVVRPPGAQFLADFRPPDLDFDTIAFDPQTGRPVPRRAEREDSVIQPPEPAPEGFTRSPAEGDVLVCPNCDIELSTGDNDVKRQVWLIKACGHVYCGECASTRPGAGSASRNSGRKKGKQPAAAARDGASTTVAPLKKCVVTSCTCVKKITTAKAMIQLYLG